MWIALSMLLLGVLAWLWFWETNAIQIKSTRINAGWTGRYVHISDIQVGRWKGKQYLHKIVRMINGLRDIEAVFVAGDWVYFPKEQQLETLFDPLKELKIPIFGTLGNHDWGEGEPTLLPRVRQRLESSGVALLDGTSVMFGEVMIVGVADHWNDPSGSQVLERYADAKHRIVIAHNPDSILTFPNSPSLTLSGHTHCGQIRIPWLYKFFLPIESKYEKGYYETPNGKLYVTCGLGESDIPLRLWNRPTIDIIETF